jgi:hypothetical protein
VTSAPHIEGGGWATHLPLFHCILFLKGYFIREYETSNSPEEAM